MRLLICAGGTGGGVYPAMSVLQQNSNNNQQNISTGSNNDRSDLQEPTFETLWVGGKGGIEVQLVEHAGIPFTAIPAAGVHGVSIKTLPGNLLKLLQGFFSARKIIRQFKPDVTYFTGGYIAVPVALAAALSRVPSLLYVPDIEPGMALKFTSKFATCIAVTCETSKQYFLPANKPGGEDSNKMERLFVTGYPTRPGLEKWETSAARSTLGLTNDLPVTLVFGGSKGARSINQALLKILPQLLERYQIIHISGQLDWPDVEKHKTQLPASNVGNYHPYPYLHENMGAAFSSSDLVVSRSGAAVLGEYPLMGIPAILVPYPHAWQYQYTNAKYLASRGAAQILRDEELSSQLLSSINRLFDDSEKLENMRKAMKNLHRPGASHRLKSLLWELGSHHTVSDMKKGSLWSS